MQRLLTLLAMSAATVLVSSCPGGVIEKAVSADHATTSTALSLPAADTPIASWLFDDTDATTLPDQMGNHNGTVIDVAKSGDGYYDFPGVSGDRVTVDSLGQLPAGSWDNGWTLEAWVRFDQVSTEQAILKWNANQGAHAFGLILDEPTFTFKTADGDGNVQIWSDGPPSVGALYHVAVTSTPVGDGYFELGMFVNGEQQTATAPQPSPAWTTMKPPTVDGLFSIGGEYDQGDDGVAYPSSPLDGRIYRAAVYDRPLSPSALTAHYSAGSEGNRPPVAEAGPDQTVAAGGVVTLDGSGSSDPDGDPLSFLWTQTGGDPVVLSDPTVVRPTFTAAGGSGAVSFQLVVTDSQAASGTDSVAVTVTAAPAVNRPPVAEAGPDQTVAAGGVVTLDGSGSSDPDGDPLTFLWTQTKGAHVTLSDRSVARPTFNARTNASTLTFRLMVTDSQAASSTDTVTVTVTAAPAANRPPVADAGPDQTVAAGALVTLDGSGSSDPDGDPLTYLWTQTGGDPVALSDPTVVRPTFTAASASGPLTFQLTVTDSHATSSTDTVTVTVSKRHKR